MPKICLGEDGFLKIGTMMQPRREEILSLAQREKFKGIEIHSQWEVYAHGNGGPLGRYYAEFGQEIPGLQTGHLTGTYFPLSDNPDVRRCYIGAVADAIRFIAEAGGVHVSITPPFHFPGQPREAYDKGVARFKEVLQELVAVAEKHGPSLAIEPEPNLILNGGGDFKNSITEVKDVLDTIGSKKLNVLFDFCHVNILSNHDPVGFLKELNGRVSWVHIADNDMTLTRIGTGKHLAFGEGNIDLESLLKALKEQCPSLSWLQVDTWENPEPFKVAASIGRELGQLLMKINWT